MVASEPTVRHIKETVDGKLAYWGQAGRRRPARTVVPEVLAGNNLTLEGRKLEINGLDGAQPDRSFVWIRRCGPWRAAWSCSATCTSGWPTPDAQVAPGLAGDAGAHRALKPKAVIPGHYAQSAPLMESVRYTAGYIRAFDAAAARPRTARR